LNDSIFKGEEKPSRRIRIEPKRFQSAGERVMNRNEGEGVRLKRAEGKEKCPPSQPFPKGERKIVPQSRDQEP